MNRICNNPECDNDISHKKILAKYCSIYCSSKVFSKNNKEKIKEYDRKKYQKFKDKIKLRTKEYAIKNKEKVQKWKENYSKNNKDKIKKLKHIYYLNNKNIYYNAYALRRARLLKATPKFANLDKIKEIYKNCPKGYEVDHIIPLNNSIICGLHVEWNLQYLTVRENRQKGNKLLCQTH